MARAKQTARPATKVIPKRLGSSHVNITVDPFQFFTQDVCQYIIQLTGTLFLPDLVSYAQVSQRWYSVLSNGQHLWNSATVDLLECSKVDVSTAGVLCNGKIKKLVIRRLGGLEGVSFERIMKIFTNNFTKKLVVDEVEIVGYLCFEIPDASFISWICCPSWQISFGAFSVGSGWKHKNVLVDPDAQREFIENTLSTPLEKIHFIGGYRVPRFSADNLYQLIQSNKDTLKVIKFHDMSEVFDDEKLLQLSTVISQCTRLKELYLWNLNTSKETYNTLCENVSLIVQSEFNPKCYHFTSTEKMFVITPSWLAPIWDDCHYAGNIVPNGFRRCMESAFEFNGTQEEGIALLLEMGCIQDEEIFLE